MSQVKSVTAVQAFAILAISVSALKAVQDRCIISRVDMKKEIQRCIELIEYAIRNWPEAIMPRGVKNVKRIIIQEQKKQAETTQKITEALHKWETLPCTVTERNRAAVMITVCERALWDLYDRLQSKLCRSLIRPAYDSIMAISAIEGKDGAFYSVHDEAGVMVTQLQNIVNW